MTLKFSHNFELALEQAKQDYFGDELHLYDLGEVHAFCLGFRADRPNFTSSTTLNIICNYQAGRAYRDDYLIQVGE